MPLGVQFDNVNRYRRYPFADDADMHVSGTADSTPFSVELPRDCITALRFVHVGIDRVSRVAVSSFNSGSIGFTVLDSDGNPIRARKNGEKTSAFAVSVPLTSDSILDGVWTCHDYDFSTCFSLYIQADVNKLLSAVAAAIGASSVTSLETATCNIPLAPAAVLSMRSPYVMSVLDDVGTPIRTVKEIKLVAGYNTRFDASPGTNTIIVSALSGAGAGRAYGAALSGLSKTFFASTLKTINGISANPDGNISIAGGKGLVVSPIEGTNIVNIYKAEDANSACDIPEGDSGQ